MRRFIRPIKDFVLKIVFLILRILGLFNAIVLEIEPVKTDNTIPVFHELRKREWIKHYRIILVSNHPEQIQHLKAKDVSIVRMEFDPKHMLSLLKYMLACFRAVIIMDQYAQIRKKNPATIRIFASHGSPAKSVRNYYNAKPDTDYMLNQSDFWKPINAYEFRIQEQKLVTLGYPRNDALFSDRDDLTKLLGKRYKKLVVWYPTYRQHIDTTFKNPYQKGITIPIIENESSARTIDEFAKKYGILLLIKPHPVQDVTFIKAMKLENVAFISDSFFKENHILNYEFLAQTDALITDYSSVFFDYLITGKPVALTLGDYDLYKEQVGFAIDMDIMKRCSTLLNSPEDFEPFFRDLTEGRDPLREQREEVTRLTNAYTDANSTKRVVDWLETVLPYH